jgi:hypothetical protein
MSLTPDFDYAMLEQQRQSLIQQEAESNKPATNSGQISPMGLDRIYPWNWSAGNHDFFQIRLSYYLRLIGYPNYLFGCAEGRADGAILGQDFNIARAFASANSYNNSVYGTFQLQVLGAYLMNWNTRQAATWVWNWSWQKEVAVPYHVWIGPIPIGGRVGIRGGIGCDLRLGLYGSQTTARVTPYTDLKGFAEAGVDIWFASAGVGGELTFLRCNFPVEGGAYLQWPYGRTQLVTYAKAHLDFTTLSGRFYIWGQLFGFYGDYTLWDWGGITWSGDLLNTSTAVYL